MNMEQVREIAGAVLYEGYLLYPYRHSALKNRQRWTFGVIYPRKYSEDNGGLEPWTMHTECLVAAGPASATLDIHVRFLHLLTRSLVRPGTSASPEPGAGETEHHLMAGQLAYEPWEEGIEREISAPNLALHELLAQPRRVEIAFAAGRLAEHPASPDEPEIVREQQAIAGTVIIAAERVSAPGHTDLYKLSVHIENSTPAGDEAQDRRDAILLHSFVSTHTILRVHKGRFISLLETPEELQAAARSCKNNKTWPVLVGHPGEQDTMLSSPIILYDYPQIAPESPGTLFDGTEIDEILALRILTLSDEEKAELRRGDTRARDLLARTEALSPEQFMQLHGTMRDPRTLPFTAAQMNTRQSNAPAQMQAHPGEDYPPPASIQVSGGEARVGNRVLLHPKVRADAFDLLLKNKVGRVEAIQQDFENRLYLVVTLDDDPGREQWDERALPGHRFFFFPEEVELLEDQG